MKPRVVRSLRQALDAIDNILRLTRQLGYDYRRFETDDVVRWAIERQFEVLGEAMWRVDEMDSHLRRIIPAIGEAIGLRNALHLGYDGIDTDLVWSGLDDHHRGSGSAAPRHRKGTA